MSEAKLELLTESMISGDVGGATNDPAGISAGSTTGSVVHTAPDKLTPLQRKKKKKAESTDDK